MLGKDDCRHGPFLTLGVRNGPNVSFGKKFPWNTLSAYPDIN